MNRLISSPFIRALVLGILFTLLINLFFYQNFSWLDIINSAFMSGLFLIILGAILFVIQGGFFDGIAYGFKRFLTSISGSSQYAHYIEEDVKSLPDKKHIKKEKRGRLTLTFPLIIIGLLFILLTIVGSYLIS